MAEKRDYIMARLAAARSNAQGAVDAIDACVEGFVDTEEDADGANRKGALEAVADLSGEVSRSVELAQEAFETMTEPELSEEEPEGADD